MNSYLKYNFFSIFISNQGLCRIFFSQLSRIRIQGEKMDPHPCQRHCYDASFLKFVCTYTEKVMKNWSRSSLGCWEKEMMIQRGEWKSYTYTQKVVFSSFPNTQSPYINICSGLHIGTYSFNIHGEIYLTPLPLFQFVEHTPYPILSPPGLIPLVRPFFLQ